VSDAGERDRLICTWFYAEQRGEESEYPQIGTRSSSPWFHAVYWRCVATFFATSYRVDPAAPRRLYLRQHVVPEIDGIDLERLLKRWDVEVVVRTPTYIAPVDYYPMWRCQFFLLDLLDHLAETLGDDEAVVLLDSDCLWTRSSDELVADVRRHGALFLDLELDPEERVNELSRRDLQSLYAAVGGYEQETIPAFFGSEILAATGATVRDLAALGPSTWEEMLRRHAAGEPKFNEEAQMFGCMFYKLGIEPGTANPHIQRIFTGLVTGSDVEPRHVDLTIWHLPNEKRLGIRRLFGTVADPRSWFWSQPVDEAWRRRLGRAVGVPQRTPTKLVRDAGRLLLDKERRRRERRRVHP
jgi:hypothetical protein